MTGGSKLHEIIQLRPGQSLDVKVLIPGLPDRTLNIEVAAVPDGLSVVDNCGMVWGPQYPLTGDPKQIEGDERW